MRKITEHDALIEISRMAIFLPYDHHAHIGVLHHTNTLSKQFCRDLLVNIESVPKWLGYDILRADSTVVHTSSARVTCASNYLRFKGCTLTALYVSSGHTPEKLEQALCSIVPCFIAANYQYTFF